MAWVLGWTFLLTVAFFGDRAKKVSQMYFLVCRIWSFEFGTASTTTSWITPPSSMVLMVLSLLATFVRQCISWIDNRRSYQPQGNCPIKKKDGHHHDSHKAHQEDNTKEDAILDSAPWGPRISLLKFIDWTLLNSFGVWRILFFRAGTDAEVQVRRLLIKMQPILLSQHHFFVPLLGLGASFLCWQLVSGQFWAGIFMV